MIRSVERILKKDNVVTLMSTNSIENVVFNHYCFVLKFHIAA